MDNQSDPGGRPTPRKRAAGEVDVPMRALHAVIVTPAALRAITAEAERRAASPLETDEDQGHGTEAAGGDAAEGARG